MGETRRRKENDLAEFFLSLPLKTIETEILVIKIDPKLFEYWLYLDIFYYLFISLFSKPPALLQKYYLIGL